MVALQTVVEERWGFEGIPFYRSRQGIYTSRQGNISKQRFHPLHQAPYNLQTAWHLFVSFGRHITVPCSLFLVYSTPGSKASDYLKTVERLDCIQVKQSVNHETASLLLRASFGRHITALYAKKNTETLLFLVQSALESYKQLQRV